MKVTRKLLAECRSLSVDEKALLACVDVDGQPQVRVAKHLGKSPSTVSKQLKKARAKFSAWANRNREVQTTLEEDFDRKVYSLFLEGDPPHVVIAKLGRASQVHKLWRQYLELAADDYTRAFAEFYGVVSKEDCERECGDYADEYPLAARAYVATLKAQAFKITQAFIFSELKEIGLADDLEDWKDVDPGAAVMNLVALIKRLQAASG